MARIYLSQGQLDRAEAIFRHLVAQQPGDPQYAEGLREVQRRRAALEYERSTDRCIIAKEGGRIRCSWLVCPSSSTRAARLLEAPVELALRLVGFPHEDFGQRNAQTRLRGDAESAESRLVTITVAEAESELVLNVPPGSLVCAAAIGLCDANGQFVSIAHSDLVSLSSS